MDPNNRERSERAQELMVVYSDMVGEHPDMEILVRDVLTDLFHALGAESMHRAIDMAETHYNAETDEEADV